MVYSYALLCFLTGCKSLIMLSEAKQQRMQEDEFEFAEERKKIAKSNLIVCVCACVCACLCHAYTDEEVEVWEVEMDDGIQTV